MSLSNQDFLIIKILLIFTYQIQFLQKYLNHSLWNYLTSFSTIAS